MDEKKAPNKVVTRKMMEGVKPGVVLPPCPEMGKLPYDEAVKLNAKMNAQATVSVKLAGGDEESAIALMEQLGYKVEKKGSAKPVDKKPETKKETIKETK